MKYKKFHPYTIFNFMGKFTFLLIIPIFQQIVFRPVTFKETLISLWKDISLIILVFAWSFIKYRSIKYVFSHQNMVLKKGIFIKEKIIIPIKNIDSINVVKKLFPSFLGSYKVLLDVPSNNSKKEFISLNISRSDLEEIKKILVKVSKYNIIYKADKKKIILLSIFWSNPIANFILVAPIVYRFSKILGEELSKKIYSTFDFRVSLMAFGLPPLIASFAYILLVAFVIAFLIQFFRYFNFESEINEKSLFIKRGFINKDEKIIPKNNIASLSVKQTLLMKFLNLYNVYIYTKTSANTKGRGFLVLMSAGYSDVINFIKKSDMPIIFFNKPGIKPNISTIKNFLVLPLFLFICAMYFNFRLSAEFWYSQTIFMFFRLLMIFFLWWMLLRLQAHKNSGIAFYNGVLNICGFKKMTLNSEYISVSNISNFKITQNVFQRISKRCHIEIEILSDRKIKYNCKHLNLNDVENFVELVKNYKI